MDCKKAIKMVPEYIKGNISDEESEELLEHIKVCPECKEELDIYYSIFEGLKQLDNDDYDKSQELTLNQFVRGTYRRLRIILLTRIWTYVVDTLVVLSVILTVLLQIRIWHELGIL